jgi:hypothetical protein
VSTQWCFEHVFFFIIVKTTKTKHHRRLGQETGLKYQHYSVRNAFVSRKYLLFVFTLQIASGMLFDFAEVVGTVNNGVVYNEENVLEKFVLLERIKNIVPRVARSILC